MRAEVADAAFERIGQLGRALAHVLPDDDMPHHGLIVPCVHGLLDQVLRAAEADLPRQLLIERLGICRANVVRFEDLPEHGSPAGWKAADDNTFSKCSAGPGLSISAPEP